MSTKARLSSVTSRNSPRPVRPAMQLSHVRLHLSAVSFSPKYSICIARRHSYCVSQYVTILFRFARSLSRWFFSSCSACPLSVGAFLS
eukprot:304800-Rhodomonas_salina.1